MKELIEPPKAPMLIGEYVDEVEFSHDPVPFVLMPYDDYTDMRAKIERAENKLAQFIDETARGVENNYAPVGIKVLQFVLGKDPL